MKSTLLGLLWRFLIGIGVAIVGIVVSAITGNWNIEYWWFGGFGILMMVLAGLPFTGGSSSAAGVAWVRPEAFEDEYKNSRNSISGTMNWMITTFLIGIVNLLTAVLAYHIHH